MSEQSRAESVLDDLLLCEGGLKASELDFIENMDGNRNIEWTERQIAWLDRIYERVC